MRSIIVSFLILVVSVVAAPENYIHGGESASRYEKPFVVSIQLKVGANFRHVCGGVIIRRQWVLTAGICLDPAGTTDVLSGKYDLSVFEPLQQRRGTLKRASTASLDGKLSLIRLATPFDFDDHTQQAYLAGPRNPGVPGENATLVGWSYNENFDPTPGIQTMKKATFKILTTDECRSLLGESINIEREFCTGVLDEETSGQISSCNGNLGSPLYQNRFGMDYVIGILVGHPSPCNATNISTGVYARIPMYYRWISGVVDQ